MTNWVGSCLGSCSPPQILNISSPISQSSTLTITDDCGTEYSTDLLNYSYSIDGTCWTCYMTYEEYMTLVSSLNTDFYVRIKVKGPIGSVSLSGTTITNYSAQLASDFNFTYCTSSSTSSNMYNPYANMDCAISLQQYLTETVSCMFGVQIYYFKLTPETKSKDITFKEYTLMNVDSVKQIKMIVTDGVMPSSKPEFSDFGLDWQTDWETEITKNTFATAFGVTAQPQEGDLIYVPMMKRMWMVNEAYEEKNQSLMWNATTFKLALVKYQEKDSVDLGDTEQLVNSLVKNKYQDLFGDEEPLDSGIESLEAPQYAANNLYPIFESDATRKYISCNTVNIVDNESLYYKGTLIADSKYEFTDVNNAQVVYQRKLCGTDGVISFIIKPNVTVNRLDDHHIISIGKYFSIDITQSRMNTILTVNKDKEKLKLTGLSAQQTYFVILRWSKELNTIDFSAYEYTYDKDLPQYKINNYSYKFDINHPICRKVTRYNKEFEFGDCEQEIVLSGFYGSITNIKVFDIYNDNISQILQMYPTHQHLILNDTVRKVVDGQGVMM